MSRLTDALRVLLGKCTPAGTQPVGDKVDDFMECLAAHYTVAQLLVTVTLTDGGKRTADKTYTEIAKAIKDGVNVRCLYGDALYQVSFVNSYCVKFYNLIWSVAEGGVPYEITLNSLQLNNANEILTGQLKFTE